MIVPPFRGRALPGVERRWLGSCRECMRRWSVLALVAEALKKDAPLELYNLASDPSEQRDVAADNPKVVAQIENYLKGARTESARWPVK